MRVRGFEQELRREDAVVLHGLVVAAELVELAVLRGILRQERRRPLRPVVAGRRIAEERRVDVMAGIDLPRALRRVPGDLPLAIDAALIEQREEAGRRCRRRCPAPGSVRVSQLGSIAPKKNKSVLDDRAADRRADVAQVGPERLHGAVRRLKLLPVAFDALRPRVAEHAALDLVGAALRDDIDDAADRLAELGLVAAGLHLHFFHEVVRRAVAERAEDDRVRAERAVAGVRDVHAIDHVRVVEAAATAPSTGSSAGAAAAGDARRDVKRVTEAAAHWNVGEHRTVEHGADGRRLRIDDRR